MLAQRLKLNSATRIGLASIDPKPGALCYCCDTKEMYVGNNTSWMLVMSSADKSRLDSIASSKLLRPRICTQCGAPLYGYKCEYCDTEYT